MTNLNLAERDGGHYDEDVFFTEVEDSGAILDWWVTTDSWRHLLTSLRSIDLDLESSFGGVGRVADLIRYMEKDLPADVNARFPAGSGELNSRNYTRRTFYRLGEDVKQHIHLLQLAASLKFRDDKSLNRILAQKAPMPPATSLAGSCTSCGSEAIWVKPTRSPQEARASYFMHLSGLDSYKPPIYNRKKFEDEFGLVWIPGTSEIAISRSG